MAIRLIFYGRVQGVGFRKFVKAKADQLGVRGYVRNLPDGTVEVIAEADQNTLERFVEAIKHGPERAYVENFTTEEIKIEVDKDEFEIRY